MKAFLGYTLIELMTVLIIVASLSCVAIPGWRDLMASHQATAAANQLLSAINFARSEAVKRRVTITLCQSKDHKTCSGEWSDGQLVFIGSLKQKKIVNPTDILRVFDPLANKASLTWNAKGPLQIMSSGMMDTTAGTFCYLPADKDKKYRRAIIVSKTGRAKVSREVDC